MVAERQPAYLLLVLGSNVSPERNIDRALELLYGQFSVVKQSARVLTAAQDDAPPYLNLALLVHADMQRQSEPRSDLKLALREIEARVGRIRPSSTPMLCPIDIDAVAQWPPLLVLDEKTWRSSYFAALMAHIEPWFATP